MPQQQRATDAQVCSAYARYKTTRAAGDALGISCQAVHQRLVRMGVMRNKRRWAPDEDRWLRKYYAYCAREGKIMLVANWLERSYKSITVRACEMGLTTRR